LRHAIDFTQDWVNVTGMPVVACVPLANFEVFLLFSSSRLERHQLSSILRSTWATTRSQGPTNVSSVFSLNGVGNVEPLTRAYAKKLYTQILAHAGHWKTFDKSFVRERLHLYRFYATLCAYGDK
jgi:hypothetical protein